MTKTNKPGLTTSLDEVRQRKAFQQARQWISSYRNYVRKPDSLGHSDHSGEWEIAESFGTNADVLFDLVNDRFEELKAQVPEFRAQNYELQKTMSEVQTKNFVLFFRDRLTDVYFASAKRDPAGHNSREPLHKQPLAVQKQVASIFTQEALELAAFLGARGTVLDAPTSSTIARHSPVIYLDVLELKDHYLQEIAAGKKPHEVRHKLFGSPRLTSRNVRQQSYSVNHPSLLAKTRAEVATEQAPSRHLKIVR